MTKANANAKRASRTSEEEVGHTVEARKKTRTAARTCDEGTFTQVYSLDTHCLLQTWMPHRTHLVGLPERT